jgi:type II secretory pathway pseudopilin PulG
MTLDGAMADRRDGEKGFSLVETLMAAMLSLVVAAAVFTLMQPSNGLFASQLESSDMQQRLRVAEGTLARNLMAAGAGVYAGRQSGPLLMYVPPVLPFREGARGGDPVGTFASDRITILSVPATTAQTVLSQALAPGDLTFSPAGAEDGGCGVGDPMCGFSPNAQVLVFDESGHYDLFTIGAVNGGIASLSLNRASNTMTTSYPAGSKVVEVESHTYYLKSDQAARSGQLMHYDGRNSPDVPIVDNVVGLRFEYDGDSAPPTMLRPLDDVSSPQTTYGAPPRTVSPPFGAGENCLFVNDGSPLPAPRLPQLGNGSRSMVPLTAAQLTDGPWCPDDANPNRWDADLLRIRRIGVTLRVQAAIAALRGPAGALFANPGTSSGGSRFVPDLEIRFQISPRNLNPGR